MARRQAASVRVRRAHLRRLLDRHLPRRRADGHHDPHDDGRAAEGGVYASPYAVMTEHYFRHGLYLTMVQVVDDPIYLQEPFVRSQTWVLDTNLNVGPALPWESVDELGDKEVGWVPHYPLGTKHTEAAENRHSAGSDRGRRRDDLPAVTRKRSSGYAPRGPPRRTPTRRRRSERGASVMNRSRPSPPSLSRWWPPPRSSSQTRRAHREVVPSDRRPTEVQAEATRPVTLGYRGAARARATCT